MTPFNQACIVGSGIGALSAAVLLIRDAGMRGSRIRILEESPLPGGALDGERVAVGEAGDDAGVTPQG